MFGVQVEAMHTCIHIPSTYENGISFINFVEGGFTMSPSKLTVSSVQDLDLITKMEEDDLKKTDSVEGRNIRVGLTDLLATQGATRGTYITICILMPSYFYRQFIMIVM